jgi:L-asparaginase
MGKTSLAVQHLPWLEKQGCQVALVDLGGWKHASIEEWLEEFARELLVDLGGGASRSLNPVEAVKDLPGFLRKVSHGAKHTLIVLDEVDWLRELEYGRHLFARFRAVQSIWSRRRWPETLTLCYVSLHSLTEIAGADVAPVITTLQMADFPLVGSDGEDVARALAEGFPEGMDNREGVARRVLEEAGGQPFQTMILATEVLDRGAANATQVDAAIDAYLKGQRNHPKELFAQIADMFREEPIQAQEALNVYEQLLRDQVAPLGTPGAEFLLRSGLTRPHNGRLEPKGPIFRKFFDEAWIERTRDRLFDEQRKRKPRYRSWSREKPRICILNTGGTVGMVRRGGRVVEPRDEREFLENYSELLELADIDFEQPFVRDSINVYPEQWTQIAETIYRKRNGGYTGFVVAHGTDTMAFTASAVAFALGQNLGFPVVFTGAQATPEVLHGDSHANLLRACVVAAKGPELPEVVICFGTKVLRALRAQKRDERRFEGFESPSFPPLAEITEDILLDRERIRGLARLREDLIREPADPLGDVHLQAHFARGVLMIQLTPGLEPDFYLPALEQRDPETNRPRCSGVILQTLGAGNVANLDPYSFTAFLRWAAQAEIPVLITSPYPWSSDLAKEYAPAAEPQQLGAIVAGEMTAAAAAAKFRWAIAAVGERIDTGELEHDRRLEELREIMGRNYLGEKDGSFWQPSAKTQEPTRLQPDRNKESAA